MKQTICSKCGSEHIIPGARIASTDMTEVSAWAKYQLQVFVDESPDAFVFKKRHRASVYARICGDCGFTELFARNYRELFEAYQKSQSKEG